MSIVLVISDKEVMFSPPLRGFVGLYVCLFLSKITFKLLDGLPGNLEGGGLGQEGTNYI